MDRLRKWFRKAKSIGFRGVDYLLKGCGSSETASEPLPISACRHLNAKARVGSRSLVLAAVNGPLADLGLARTSLNRDR
jgi:hypothetical protein